MKSGDKMAGIKSKQFFYKNTIKWNEERKGTLSSLDKPDIEIATPPEFRGHHGIWTPEDLLVASVNSCIMTTFLYYAQKEHLDFIGYESSAEGILERVGDVFMISYVSVKPIITIRNREDTDRIKRIIEMSDKNCLISDSVKSKVEVIAEIKID